MTQQRDGGPAFPATLQVEVDEINKDGVIVGKCTLPKAYPGMSLRDWFAGQALPGILTAFAHQHGYMPETKDQWESVARKADICADHMIYNREEK